MEPYLHGVANEVNAQSTIEDTYTLPSEFCNQTSQQAPIELPSMEWLETLLGVVGVQNSAVKPAASWQNFWGDNATNL